MSLGQKHVDVDQPHQTLQALNRHSDPIPTHLACFILTHYMPTRHRCLRQRSPHLLIALLLVPWSGETETRIPAFHQTLVPRHHPWYHIRPHPVRPGHHTICRDTSMTFTPGHGIWTMVCPRDCVTWDPLSTGLVSISSRTR